MMLAMSSLPPAARQPDRLLITQCLQNDFVQPIGRFEPMPNLLHVGSEEAPRLLGADPSRGPVAEGARWSVKAPRVRVLDGL